MKKKLLLGIFVFGIVLFALVIKSQSITTALSSDNQKNLALSSTSSKLLDLSLTPHESIEILNDDNFTDYGFLGLGTAEEPYIIENYNITTDSYYGIYISRTTKYFIIRNCVVDSYNSGIYLHDVDDGTATIKDNICQANTNGIYLYYAFRVTVTNNSCNDKNRVGIRLWHSDNTLIIKNTCNNNWYHGIEIEKSSGVKLVNNVCCGNGNPYFTGFGDGIYVIRSSFANLTNNICNDNKINGIKLAYTSTNAIISNNTCNNAYSGIYLRDSSNATLTSNICNNHTYGMIITHCDYVVMSDTSCSENQIDGIRVFYSKFADLTNITSNSNNYSGIFLYHSSNSTLKLSNFFYNNEGIYLARTDYSNLEGNTCYNNIANGIRLHNASYCNLVFNSLLENKEYGIYLSERTEWNEIHHNSFINNNQTGISQAFDNGHNNYWYNRKTCEGNYWSGWGENDTYYIDGNAKATDPYTLNEDLENGYDCDTTKSSFAFILPLIIIIAIQQIRRWRKKLH